MNAATSSPRTALSGGPPVASLEGRLPGLTAGLARASRLAFDARFQQWLHGVDGAADAAFSAREPPAVSASAADWLLDLQTSEGGIRVALDAGPWPALEMALALDDDPAACAVAGLLIEPAVGALAGALGGLQVQSRMRGAVADRTSAIVVSAGGVRWHWLEADEQLFERFRGGLAAMPAAAVARLGALRLRPRLKLFQRSLAVDVLRALAFGDTVLLEMTPGATVPVSLWVGRGQCMQMAASYDDGSGDVRATGAPDFGTPDSPEDHEGFDALQVPVSFEVDTARISLAELASVRPGYVIELEQPLRSAEVRLVCHGQTVGRGQLVAVGEQLGVRIVAMTSGNAMPAGRGAAEGEEPAT